MICLLQSFLVDNLDYEKPSCVSKENGLVFFRFSYEVELNVVDKNTMVFIDFKVTNNDDDRVEYFHSLFDYGNWRENIGVKPSSCFIHCIGWEQAQSKKEKNTFKKWKTA
ncbi:hypothetical protein V6N13_129781 [Hibiscus sabdariffa]